MFDAELLKEVVQGCRWVWNDVAPDLYTMDALRFTKAEQVEICLDADRLLTFGYKNEYAAFQLLLEQGSWQNLCKAIIKVW